MYCLFIGFVVDYDWSNNIFVINICGIIEKLFVFVIFFLFKYCWEKVGNILNFFGLFYFLLD